jgi:AcrR family transcriptional regulator
MSDVKRPYVAPVRVEQAAETRRRVLQAAIEAFAANGWAGTTLADIARAAGVTPQAVHLSVGAKPELLIAAVGLAVAGDTPDVPLMEREPFRAAFADGAALAERAGAVAAGARDMYERAGRLFLVLVQAAPVNSAVSQLWESARGARLSYCRQLVATVVGRRKKAQVDRLADILFVLSGPRVYADLVVDRQWEAGTYEQWLSEMIVSTLRDAST